MTIDKKDLEKIIQNAEAESLHLEFKRAAALGRSDGQKKELVKDVTGFANANGGLLIYGIAEGKQDGVVVATAFDPVLDETLNSDWIHSVLRNSTDPPFSGFHVNEISIEPGKRVLAIEIDAAGTAHQNLADQRYYQRGGAATNPMVGFQIRDLLGRRQKAELKVNVGFKTTWTDSERERYQLQVAIENTGNVSVEHWRLEVDLPNEAIRHQDRPERDKHGGHHNFSDFSHGRPDADGYLLRVVFADPYVDGRRHIFHPGMSVDFTVRQPHIPPFYIEVDRVSYMGYSKSKRSIKWRMFYPDSKPLVGQIEFEDWCSFDPHAPIKYENS
ncbi:MAG: ATP-binding protein [Pseudomonadota bacterium]